MPSDHVSELQAAPTVGKLASRGSIVKVEDRAVGRVTLAVYKAYLSSWSRWYWIPGVMIGFAMAQQGMVVRPPPPPLKREQALHVGGVDWLS